jgi:hypothetical protein
LAVVAREALQVRKGRDPGCPSDHNADKDKDKEEEEEV